jgi:prepilin-type processing-associated H-X9-DG protein
LIEKEVYEKHYNTNYAASWFMVRSAALLDKNTNLKKKRPSCDASLASRNSTLGPLTQRYVDAAPVAPGFVPLLGCGAGKDPLLQAIGPHPAGTLTAFSFTAGPAVNPTMHAPGLGTWHRSRQDYRRFAPVHRGACNILFADGSVRDYIDSNGDGFLNNGFDPSSENGFTSTDIELPENEVFSGWSLR